jgi:hypothetical protein
MNNYMRLDIIYVMIQYDAAHKINYHNHKKHHLSRGAGHSFIVMLRSFILFSTY